MQPYACMQDPSAGFNILQWLCRRGQKALVRVLYVASVQSMVDARGVACALPLMCMLPSAYDVQAMVAHMACVGQACMASNHVEHAHACACACMRACVCVCVCVFAR